MNKYTKLPYVQKIRRVTDYYLLKLPLPRINPNIVSALSIVTSILFVLVLKYSKLWAFILIIITLLLDWLDGLVAKKHNLSTEKGYIVDVVADRFSEGIMFLPFFTPWFYLFVLNVLLTIFSFVKRKHIILPLRQIFLIYFFLEFII